MSNYLNHLVTRSLDPTTGLQPRLPSRFEPLSATSEVSQLVPDWDAQAISINSEDTDFRTVSDERSAVTVSDQNSVQRQLSEFESGITVKYDLRRSKKIESISSDGAPSQSSPLLPNPSLGSSVARVFPIQPNLGGQVNPTTSEVSKLSEQDVPNVQRVSGVRSHQAQRTPVEAPPPESGSENLPDREALYLHRESRFRSDKAQPTHSVLSSLQPFPERTAQPASDENESQRTSSKSESNGSLMAQRKARAAFRPQAVIKPAQVSYDRPLSNPFQEQLAQDLTEKDTDSVTQTPNRQAKPSVSELRPLISETLPLSAAKQDDSPRLVIGHLNVEVISTPVTPPIASPRTNHQPLKPPPKGTSGESLSKLRFGLGQL